MIGENHLRLVLTGKAILAILVVAVVATAAAAFSFTQHFPAIPATAPPAVIASNCSSAPDNNNLVTTTTSVVAQGSTTGFILFSCANGVAALTTSSNGGVATPTFTLPAGYLSLDLIAHAVGVTTCTGGSVALSSTFGVTFGANENWDYCASYTNVPLTGLAAFDITWSG